MAATSKVVNLVAALDTGGAKDDNAHLVIFEHGGRSGRVLAMSW
jgi:hypothetical protein